MLKKTMDVRELSSLIFLKKSTFDKNLLHNMHGQFSGFHGFIFNLNFSKLLLFLMHSGTISQFLCPKNVKVSVLLYLSQGVQ